MGTGAGLCPACRHIALLRAEQTQLAAERELTAADLVAVLDGPPAVVVQVDQHPARATPSRQRPRSAGHRRTGYAWPGFDGRRLADITVRLVGPKARWVPEGAVDPETGRAQLGKVLDDQRPVVWSAPELDQLSAITGTYLGTHATLTWTAPYPTDTYDRGPERAAQYRDWLTSERRDSPAVLLGPAAARWRGVLDPVTRGLVDPLPPGTRTGLRGSWPPWQAAPDLTRRSTLTTNSGSAARSPWTSQTSTNPSNRGTDDRQGTTRLASWPRPWTTSRAAAPNCSPPRGHRASSPTPPGLKQAGSAVRGR